MLVFYIRCIVFVSLIILLFRFPAYSSEKENSCIISALIVPIIGGDGDTPLIPVSVNGQEAAMYVSFAFDDIYLRSNKSINLPFGLKSSIVIINGKHIENASRISVEDFGLGDIHIKNISAIKLGTEISESINGKPIIGIIGRKLLSNLDIIMDIPDRKFGYLRIRDTKDCFISMDQVFGSKFQEVAMDADYRVPVRISGTGYRFGLNTDMSRTSLPRGLINNTIEYKDNRKTLYTHYDEVTKKGWGGSLEDVWIGNYHIDQLPVLFDDDLDQGYLGRSFFTDKIVLIEPRNKRLLFAIRPSRAFQSHRNDLHFFKTQSGTVDVTHSRGSVE